MDSDVPRWEALVMSRVVSLGISTTDVDSGNRPPIFSRGFSKMAIFPFVNGYLVPLQFVQGFMNPLLRPPQGLQHQLRPGSGVSAMWRARRGRGGSSGGLVAHFFRTSERV